MEHFYSEFEVCVNNKAKKAGQLIQSFVERLWFLFSERDFFIGKFKDLSLIRQKRLIGTAKLWLIALGLVVGSLSVKAQGPNPTGDQIINPMVGDNWVLGPPPGGGSNAWTIQNPNINPAASPPLLRNGLRIDIKNGGTFRVNDSFRENYANMAVTIRIGGAAPSAGFTACATVPVKGAGTPSDPFITVNVYRATSGSGRVYTVYQRITYTVPNNFFFMDFEVVGDDRNEAENVDIYVSEDTFPGGDDAANGWVNSPTNPTIVAGRRTDALDRDRPTTAPCGTAGGNCGPSTGSKYPASLVYKSASGGFTSYYSGLYCSRDILNGTLLQNVVDNNCQDHGMAVHWSMGTFLAKEGKTRRLMLGYGNTVTDFDGVNVVNPTSAISGSTPVTVRFEQNSYNVNEGDIADMTSVSSTLKGIKVRVSGGTLNAAVPILIEYTGGSYPTTKMNLIPGFEIPPGNYLMSQVIEINNLRISGNLLNETNDIGSISLYLNAACNFLTQVDVSGANTTINVKDDDDIVVGLEKIQDGAEQASVPAKFKVKTQKGVTSTNPITVTLDWAGSTANNADFISPLPSLATITAGQSETIVSLTPNDDLIIEGDEIVKVTATGVGGTFFRAGTVSPTANSLTLTISDNDNTPAKKVVRISSDTIVEGTSKVFNVSILNNYTATIPITVTINPIPSFPLGYTVDVSSVTGPFTMVIAAGQTSKTFTINTVDDGQVADNVFALSGTVTPVDFTVIGGTVTVTNVTVRKLEISNKVIPAAGFVGEGVTYTTVISNPGTSNIGSDPAKFSITTTGIDINPLSVTVAAIRSSAGIIIQYQPLSSSPGSGYYVYNITNLPAGGSITLTYSGTISSTASSAINDAQITPPTTFSNSAKPRSVAQTFIKPKILDNPGNFSICSGQPINPSLRTDIPAFSSYIWSRTINPDIPGPLNGSGRAVTETLTNRTNNLQSTTYTVTPTTVADKILPDGTISGVETTSGEGKTFTVTVKGQGVSSASTAMIQVDFANYNGVLVLTPSVSSDVQNPVFRWYSSTNTLGGSINDGTINVATGERRIPIVSPLAVGDRYNYYVTVSGDNTCESVVKDSFVDKIPSVDGARTINIDDVIVDQGLTATVNVSISNGSLLTAPVSIQIDLSALPASYLAINREGDRVYGGGGNRSSITVTMRIRSSVADFSIKTDASLTTRIFALSGTAVDYLVNSGSLTVLGSGASSNTIIDISEYSLFPGETGTLVASVRSGTAVTRDVVIVLDKGNLPAGYRVNNRGVYIPGNITVTISTGSNSVAFPIETDRSITWTTTLGIGGTASGYTVVSGGLRIIGDDIPRERVLELGSYVVQEGGIGRIKLGPVSGTTVSEVPVSVRSQPMMPNAYSVNGVGVTQPFSVRIPSGSGVGEFAFGIQTADDSVGWNRDFILNGSTTSSEYLAVHSGYLAVIDKNFPYLQISQGVSVSEGSTATLTIRRISGVGGVTVSLSSQRPSPSNFAINIVPSRIYVPAGVANVEFQVQALDGNHPIYQSELFVIQGSSSDTSYRIGSGDVRVLSKNMPSDRTIVIRPQPYATVVAGSSQIMTASISNSANVSSDVGLQITTDFPSGYVVKVNGLTVGNPNLFGLTITSGNSSAQFTVETAAGRSGYYAIGGTAPVGYYLVSGGLSAVVNPPSDRTIVIRPQPYATVVAGSSQIMTASISNSANVSSDVGLQITTDFPSGYVVKVNGLAVGDPNSFGLTITSGNSSAQFTVETAAGRSGYYAIGGTAPVGYYLVSGGLSAVVNPPSDRTIVIRPQPYATVVAGSSQIMTASISNSANVSSDVGLQITTDFPSGYVVKVNGLTVGNPNLFGLTITSGNSSAQFTVETAAGRSGYYAIGGTAPVGYYLVSGGLSAVVNPPSDRTIVIRPQPYATVVAGSSQIMTASISNSANVSSDVGLQITTGFPSGYVVKVNGLAVGNPNSFGLTITSGNSSAQFTVETAAGRSGYYAIGGTAPVGYYLVSGGLSAVVNPPSDRTIVIRPQPYATVVAGSSQIMTASISNSANVSSDVGLQITTGFPSGYVVKVNGLAVGNPNSFGLTITSGNSSAQFTVETAAGRSGYYAIGGTAPVGYYLVSGGLSAVVNPPSDRTIVIRPQPYATVVAGSSQIMTASISNSANVSSDVGLQITTDFPSGYVVKVNGLTVGNPNLFGLTITSGNSSAQFTVETAAGRSGYYAIGGTAPVGYYLVSGGLSAVVNPPSDRTIVIRPQPYATVVAGSSQIMTASISNSANVSSDVGLQITTDFPSGYVVKVNGLAVGNPNSFGLTITSGNSSAQFTVETAAGRSGYYAIGGTAPVGYYLVSGGLSAVVNPPSDRTIVIRPQPYATVVAGSSQIMTASISNSANVSSDVGLQITTGFPSGYVVKVNGLAVGNPNSFGLTITSGNSSAQFTVETAAGRSGYYAIGGTAPVGYYLVSGGLSAVVNPPSDRTIVIRPQPYATVVAGSSQIMTASISNSANVSSDVGLQITTDFPSGYVVKVNGLAVGNPNSFGLTITSGNSSAQFTVETAAGRSGYYAIGGTAPVGYYLVSGGLSAVVNPPSDRTIVIRPQPYATVVAGSSQIMTASISNSTNVSSDVGLQITTGFPSGYVVKVNGLAVGNPNSFGLTITSGNSSAQFTVETAAGRSGYYAIGGTAPVGYYLVSGGLSAVVNPPSDRTIVIRPQPYATVVAGSSQIMTASISNSANVSSDVGLQITTDFPSGYVVKVNGLAVGDPNSFGLTITSGNSSAQFTVETAAGRSGYYAIGGTAPVGYYLVSGGLSAVVNPPSDRTIVIRPQPYATVVAGSSQIMTASISNSANVSSDVGLQITTDFPSGYVVKVNGLAVGDPNSFGLTITSGNSSAQFTVETAAGRSGYYAIGGTAPVGYYLVSGGLSAVVNPPSDRTIVIRPQPYATVVAGSSQIMTASISNSANVSSDVGLQITTDFPSGYVVKVNGLTVGNPNLFGLTITSGNSSAQFTVETAAGRSGYYAIGGTAPVGYYLVSGGLSAVVNPPSDRTIVIRPQPYATVVAGSSQIMTASISNSANVSSDVGLQITTGFPSGYVVKVNGLAVGNPNSFGLTITSGNSSAQFTVETAAGRSGYYAIGGTAPVGYYLVSGGLSAVVNPPSDRTIVIRPQPYATVVAGSSQIMTASISNSANVSSDVGLQITTGFPSGYVVKVNGLAVGNPNSFGLTITSGNSSAQFTVETAAGRSGYYAIGGTAPVGYYLVSGGLSAVVNPPSDRTIVIRPQPYATVVAGSSQIMTASISNSANVSSDVGLQITTDFPSGYVVKVNGLAVGNPNSFGLTITSGNSSAQFTVETAAGRSGYYAIGGTAPVGYYLVSGGLSAVVNPPSDRTIVIRPQPYATVVAGSSQIMTASISNSANVSSDVGLQITTDFPSGYVVKVNGLAVGDPNSFGLTITSGNSSAQFTVETAAGRSGYYAIGGTAPVGYYLVSGGLSAVVNPPSDRTIVIRPQPYATVVAGSSQIMTASISNSANVSSDVGLQITTGFPSGYVVKVNGLAVGNPNSFGLTITSGNSSAQFTVETAAGRSGYYAIGGTAPVGYYLVSGGLSAVVNPPSDRTIVIRPQPYATVVAGSSQIMTASISNSANVSSDVGLQITTDFPSGYVVKVNGLAVGNPNSFGLTITSGNSSAQFTVETAAGRSGYYAIGGTAPVGYYLVSGGLSAVVNPPSDRTIVIRPQPYATVVAGSSQIMTASISNSANVSSDVGLQITTDFPSGYVVKVNGLAVGNPNSFGLTITSGNSSAQFTVETAAGRSGYYAIGGTAPAGYYLVSGGLSAVVNPPSDRTIVIRPQPYATVVAGSSQIMTASISNSANVSSDVGLQITTGFPSGYVVKVNGLAVGNPNSFGLTITSGNSSAQFTVETAAGRSGYYAIGGTAPVGYYLVSGGLSAVVNPPSDRTIVIRPQPYATVVAGSSQIMTASISNSTNVSSDVGLQITTDFPSGYVVKVNGLAVGNPNSFGLTITSGNSSAQFTVETAAGRSGYYAIGGTAPVGYYLVSGGLSAVVNPPSDRTIVIRPQPYATVVAGSSQIMTASISNSANVSSDVGLQITTGFPSGYVVKVNGLAVGNPNSFGLTITSGNSSAQFTVETAAGRSGYYAIGGTAPVGYYLVSGGLSAVVNPPSDRTIVIRPQPYATVVAGSSQIMTASISNSANVSSDVGLQITTGFPSGYVVKVNGLAVGDPNSFGLTITSGNSSAQFTVETAAGRSGYYAIGGTAPVGYYLVSGGLSAVVNPPSDRTIVIRPQPYATVVAGSSQIMTASISNSANVSSDVGLQITTDFPSGYVVKVNGLTVGNPNLFGLTITSGNSSAQFTVETAAGRSGYYAIGGTAPVGYYLVSGGLSAVVNPPSDRTIVIRPQPYATVVAGSSQIMTASISNSANVSSDVGLQITTGFPSGYVVKVNGLAVGNPNSFGLTITSGNSSAQFTVETAAGRSGYYAIGGTAPVGYYLVSGGLSAVVNPPSDRTIVIRPQPYATVVAGSSQIMTASISNSANVSSDVGLQITTGFPSGYVVKVNGLAVGNPNSFGLTITSGNSSAQFTVETAAGRSGYYAIGGTAPVGYYLVSGGLSAVVNPPSDRTIVIRPQPYATVVAGSSQIMTASISNSANVSSDVGLQITTDFPSGYVVKVNGLAVGNPNSFGLTITSGNSSAQFTVETAAGRSGYYAIGGTAPVGYYLVSGGLSAVVNPPSDRTIVIRPQPYATVVAGSCQIMTASISNSANVSSDVGLQITTDFPSGYVVKVNGLAVGDPNSFGLTITSGNSSAQFTVETAAGRSGYYAIGGTAPVGYYLVSGGLSAVVNPPSDRTIVIRPQPYATVVAGSSQIMTASISNSANVSSDVGLQITTGFPSGYVVKVNGLAVGNPNSFGLTITSGNSSAQFTVETAAGRSGYYAIGGTAPVGYYLVSGGLSAVVNPPSDRTIVIRPQPYATVVAGSSQIMTASISNSANVSSDVGLQITTDFPSGYVVKVNGLAVGNPNSFGLTITSGNSSAQFTVETAAGRSGYYAIGGTAPVGYYLISGGLTVIPYNKVVLSADKYKVVEGTDVTLSLSSTRVITVEDGSVSLNVSRYPISSTNNSNISTTMTISPGSSLTSSVQRLTLSNTVGEDEILVIRAIDPNGVYMVSPISITVQAYPVVVVKGSLSSCDGDITDLSRGILNYNPTIYSYTSQLGLGAETNTLQANTSGVYQVFAVNKASGLKSRVGGSITVTNRPKIEIKLSSTKAISCGGSSVDLNSYIESISPSLISGTYTRSFKDGRGNSVNNVGGEYLVSATGNYTILVTDPTSGCVGRTTLEVVLGVVPSISVTPTIIGYQPFVVNLTLPSVVVGTNVDHYNYYDSSSTTMTTASAQNITSAGIYYIQGVSVEGCLSSRKQVSVSFRPQPIIELVASTDTLVEGEEGDLELRLVNPSDPSDPVILQQNLSFSLTYGTGNTAVKEDYSISQKKLPMNVVIEAGTSSIHLPLKALSDKVLYDNDLLVTEAKNGILGTKSKGVKIIDATALDPKNRQITIEDGTIYFEDTIPIKVYLPNGVTTSQPISVTLKTSTRSMLNHLSSMPTYTPQLVTIEVDKNAGEFNVSGSSSSDIPAKLIIEGVSSLADFPVREGTITILNQKIGAQMSVSDNLDLINDFSEIKNIEKFPDNEVSIFDRWGTTVWYVKGYNNKDKDRTFRGESNQGLVYSLPEGIYYYVIRFEDKGKTEIFKGYLKLKRATNTSDEE